MIIIRTLTILTIIMALALPAGAARYLPGKVVNLELDSPALDTAVSADGLMTLVLTAAGAVHILDQNGTLVQSFGVGEGYENIAYNSAHKRIILSGPASLTVKFIDLETVTEIDTTGSPYKGSAEAPVTVAVFSDFQ
jgi:hypothetical protein